jgi:hypothetical protein
MDNNKGRVVLPIVNFDCQEDIIKLDDTLSIKRIDKETLILLGNPFLERIRGLFTQNQFFIEKIIENPGSLQAFTEISDWLENSPNIQRIASALRLIGVGDFSIPTALLFSNSIYVDNNIIIPSFFEKRSALPKQEIAVFIQLWNRLNTIENDKPYLKFSLFQFNKSFTENSLEFSWIDCVTSFESIVFHNMKNTPRPIGPVIGIAIGMLIGKDEGERSEIKKILTHAYETRNTIVHGHLRKEDIDYNDEKEFLFYFKVRDYLRRVLRKLLEE